jgi:hypothetical protein
MALLLTVVLLAGCDDSSESTTASDETSSGFGWCNTECNACDTELSRSEKSLDVVHGGEASTWKAEMSVEWELCCCNTCWPTFWFDDLEKKTVTTQETWDTGTATTRPKGAGLNKARQQATNKLARATVPSCP